MSKLSIYDIAYKGLKEGLHEFEYVIDDKFFERIGGDLIEKANIKANVLLEKRSSLLSMSIQLNGTVKLMCDWCLEEYEENISFESKVFVKFGLGRNEDNEEVFWVSPEANEINIAQLLYEFSVLSLPVIHRHPENEKGESTCDPEMLNKIEKYSYSHEEKTDERWDALKKLRNSN